MNETPEPEDAPAPTTESWTSRELAVRIAGLVDEKQAEDILVLEVGPAFQVTDYFVIASGQNRRHLAAMAENVAKELKTHGIHRIGGSSLADENWVLLDFGSVVFHAFSAEARGYYDLENLWGDCEKVDWRAERVDTPQTPPGDDDEADESDADGVTSAD